MNDYSQMSEDELLKVLTDKMDKLSDEYIKIKQQLEDANKIVGQVGRTEWGGAFVLTKQYIEKYGVKND